MSVCQQGGLLRDYAFEELSGADRAAMERHVAACGDCAEDLRAITLTTATLRSLPDREVPQRIAFVSDKLFEPSPWLRFFRGFFGSGTQVGFAAACLLAAAIFFAPARRPGEIRTVVTAASGADVTRQIDAAVKKAVAQVHDEDLRLTQVALNSAEAKHAREHKELLAAMQESVDVMQKRMGAYTSLASLDMPVSGGGQ